MIPKTVYGYFVGYSHIIGIEVPVSIVSSAEDIIAQLGVCYQVTIFSTHGSQVQGSFRVLVSKELLDTRE